MRGSASSTGVKILGVINCLWDSCVSFSMNLYSAGFGVKGIFFLENWNELLSFNGVCWGKKYGVG